MFCLDIVYRTCVCLWDFWFVFFMSLVVYSVACLQHRFSNLLVDCILLKAYPLSGAGVLCPCMVAAARFLHYVGR